MADRQSGRTAEYGLSGEVALAKNSDYLTTVIGVFVNATNVPTVYRVCCRV